MVENLQLFYMSLLKYNIIGKGHVNNLLELEPEFNVEGSIKYKMKKIKDSI